MQEYIVTGKKYLVENPQQLFEQIKGESSHTKDLELQDYLDNVVAEVINNMTKYKISLPAKAEDVIEVWKKMGVIEN